MSTAELEAHPNFTYAGIAVFRFSAEAAGELHAALAGAATFVAGLRGHALDDAVSAAFRAMLVVIEREREIAHSRREAAAKLTLRVVPSAGRSRANAMVYQLCLYKKCQLNSSAEGYIIVFC